VPDVWSSKCLWLLSCWPGIVIATISYQVSHSLSVLFSGMKPFSQSTARSGSAQKAQLSSAFTVKLVEFGEMVDNLKPWPAVLSFSHDSKIGLLGATAQ